MELIRRTIEQVILSNDFNKVLSIQELEKIKESFDRFLHLPYQIILDYVDWFPEIQYELDNTSKVNYWHYLLCCVFDNYITEVSSIEEAVKYVNIPGIRWYEEDITIDTFDSRFKLTENGFLFNIS